MAEDEKKRHVRWQPADVDLCRPDEKEGKKVLIQYLFLTFIISHLQFATEQQFGLTVYVFGSLESLTPSVKEVITTVTYNVITCAVELVFIIKHLPCF